MSDLSETAATILGMLMHRPYTAYELGRTFDQSPAILDRIKAGSVHAVLTRLEERGLVASQVELSEGGRSRRNFSVNGVGRDAFREWLNQPLTEGEVIEEVVIFYKLLFARHGLSRERADAQLAQIVQIAGKQLELFREFEDSLAEKGCWPVAPELEIPPEFIRLCMNRATNDLENLIAWARDSRRDIKTWPAERWGEE